MKPIIDAIQIAIQTPGTGFVLAFILVVLAAQAWKLLSFCATLAFALARESKRVVFRFWGLKRIVWLSVLALPVYLFSAQVSCGLQYLEQMYVAPTYIVADSSAWAVECYETELRKHTSPAQFQTVRDSTYKLASDLGCDPLAIYEVAWSECGMNPFCIRKDGVAAGWIQFTGNGLSGFGVTLEEVKRWCADGDTEKIMALTGRYMRSWAAGRKLLNSTQVYCTVFAPGKIGVAQDGVLYSGWTNDCYRMNKGLDGFVIAGNKALHLPYTIDGKLTKQDLTAALAYKKARLLSRYK